MKIGKFVSLISVLFAATFLFIFPANVSAQVSIGKFYSQGTYKNKPLDWVEIVNNSSSNLNLINYKIKDSNLSEANTYRFAGDTILGPGQSCIKDVGQILNKDEDIIYLFNASDQIYCLEYGTTKSDCTQASEFGLNPQKPVPDCASYSPSPTSPPTNPPTPTTKATIIPFVDLETEESSPTPVKTAPPQVLSINAQTPEAKVDFQTQQVEDNKQAVNQHQNYIAFLMIAVGASLIGYSILLLRNKLKNKYNNEYGSNQEN